MKRTFYTFLILVIFQLKFIFAQNFIYNFNGLSIQPDTSIKIFQLSQNPALLNYDEDEELLYIKTSFSSSDEKLKRYFDPGKINFYQVRFSGKKKIGDNQIFKGIFEFNKLIRKNWNWIFNKDYDSGNPFLLGDSSSGSSTFNGIYFNANYFNQIFENSSVGAGLEYFVDEGLKQVSPKPTSQHRNIKFTLGVNYSPLRLINLSLSGIVEDKKEDISYKEDESAVYREIILMKFRGIDYPIIVKKKTETRILYLNNYAISGDITFRPYNSFLFYSRINKGIEQTVSKEEITNPSNQGYFQNDYLNFEMKSEAVWTERLKTNLSFKFFNSSGWAKHPSFYSLLSEQEQSLSGITGNVFYRFNDKLSLNLGVGFGQFKFDLNDYYSNVLFSIKSQLFSLQTGLKFYFTNAISISTNFLIEKHSPISSKEFYENSGIYFLSFLKNDLDYFKTGFNRYNLSFLIMMQLFAGEVLFAMDYNYLKPVSSSVWNNVQNRNIKSFIEYRVKVY